MNPFETRALPAEKTLMTFGELRPTPYPKREVDPYTRCRVILMNGTEYEQVWFTHQFSRNCTDAETRRVLALLRRSEQEQQKLLCHLKPADETMLEHTIGYEQLAVDLTAHLAARVEDDYVKKALDFALLEDFDHLYRYADYLEMEGGCHAEELVGRYTEIMPGRPTVAHYRHPFDTVRRPIDAACAAPFTRLTVGIITAAEQQTMNYYMNVCAAYPTDFGRGLYQEIGMVEEDHVTHYGSLLDSNLSWYENLVMHQYTEAYLYYSCLQTETYEPFFRIWEKLYEQEVSHLHLAADLLKRKEGKDAAKVVGGTAFPAPLRLESNVAYVRDVLGRSVQVTGCKEDYTCVNSLEKDADFFRYQAMTLPNLCDVHSHTVIEEYIRRHGCDYRFETASNPIFALRDRTVDNTAVGRVIGAEDACEL
ncbi:MAG: hypothetical protein IKT43_00730 [Clostridia bacterium]|nr:hypothetical protein [Clostridia bacterium]